MHHAFSFLCIDLLCSVAPNPTRKEVICLYGWVERTGGFVVSNGHHARLYMTSIFGF